MDKDLKDVNGAVLKLSSNGWMNEKLTHQYLREQIGALVFSRRLLMWDTYRCHISESVKTEMNRMKIDKALIPGS